MEDVPGGNRDRGGGSSPAPLGEAAGSALFIQLLFRNSVVATDALWPPNGGWAARLGLWERQLAAESPSPFGREEGVKDRWRGCAGPTTGAAALDRSTLAPCTIKVYFFPPLCSSFLRLFTLSGWRGGRESCEHACFFPSPVSGGCGCG